MLANFVLETCNAPGTGSVTPLGAPSGRITFVTAFGSGAKAFYTLTDGTQTEEGWTVTGSTMTRNVIWTSAGGTSPLNFTSACQIFNTLPAERSMWADDSSVYQGRNRRLTGLATAIDPTGAPRLDQVGWELLSSQSPGSAVASILTTVSGTPYYRFRAEITRATPSTSAIGFLRFSQDGGTTYKSGTSDYLNTTQVWNSGGIAITTTAGSYLSLSEASTYPLFGAIEFDYLGSYMADMIGQNSSPSWSGVSQRGACNLSARITNIQFAFTSGNINSGLFRLLGARY